MAATSSSSEKQQRISTLLAQVQQRSKITQRAIAALVGSVVADAAVCVAAPLSLVFSGMCPSFDGQPFSLTCACTRI
jgi:hypothetical protein